MSKQVNFFADGTDAASLETFLIDTFKGRLGLLPGFRGSAGSFRFIRFVDNPVAIAEQEVAILVPAWAAGRLRIEPIEKTDEVFLNIRESPLLEYSPSRLEDDGKVLAVGRLFWAYQGQLERSERAEIESVFRWVRTNTLPVPNTRGFRLFRSAAAHAAFLRSWGGPAEPNPLLKKAGVGC